MKLKITLFLLGLTSLSGFAQDKTYDLLKEKTATHILYDRVFSVSNATEPRKTVSANYFFQVYHEMQRADFDNRLPKLEVIKKAADMGFVQKQIPLSLLITDFETLNKTAIDDHTVALNANNQFEAKNNATTLFTSHNLNIIAPLLSKTKTNQVSFILKDELIFNTTNRVIASIYIQSEEDNNWRKVNFNQAFQVSFSKNGKQNIHCKIEFSNGEATFQDIEIEVDNQITANTNKTNSLSFNTVNTLTASIPYQGYDETAAYLAQGEFEIFPDTVDGILDKPIFLLDGFDPGDSRNIPGIYSLLNYGTSGQNLGDIVRAQGYDVIILNFPTYTRTGTTTVVDGGVDYIQRNAMLLVELINQVNAQKQGTAQNVVIGPSMGGLIARYALRYMEQHTLTHDARLYISFDSPHLGANVPIGFQHLFNYMGFGPVGDTTMQSIVNGMLKSPAAREMLIDQFEGHLQSGSATEFLTTPSTALLPTGCPNFRSVFQNELNTMGFPTTTRNVAIVNGAGNGTMTGTPGMSVMNHTFNTSSTQRAIINVNFTPVANSQLTVSHFQGQQWVLFWFTAYDSAAISKSPTYTDGLDSAPGGRFDMSSLASLGAGNATMTEFMNNLQIMYFDFIPVWSSMCLSNTTNLYTPLSTSSVTPFLASSVPTTNENHVTLTDTNVAFALNEILGTLNTHESAALNSVWIKNPMESAIQINSSYAIENASINITDILGKTVYTANNQNIEGTLEIPLNISNGVYLITIKNDQGSITKKFIKG
jgi:hypothetical protein